LHSIVAYPDSDLFMDLLLIVRMDLAQDRQDCFVECLKIFIGLMRYLFGKERIVRIEIDIVYD